MADSHDDDVNVASAVFSSIQQAVDSDDEYEISDVIALLDQQPINVRRHIFLKEDTEHDHSLVWVALQESTGCCLMKYVLEQSANDQSLRVNINSLLHCSDCNVAFQASPLWIAVNKQKQATVALLLAHGADPNVYSESNEDLHGTASPLLMSLSVANSTTMSRRITMMLLDHGADVAVVNHRGVTAVMLAACYQPALVEPILMRLRANGCDVTTFVNMRDVERLTALHYSAGISYKPIFDVNINAIKLLCTEGANLYAENFYGRDLLRSGCAHLWGRYGWMPQQLWSRVSDLIAALQVPLVRQWQVWELIGAEVALATRHHLDVNNDESPWPAEWDHVYFWQLALSVRHQLSPDDVPSMPLPIFDSYVEPVTTEALEQLRDNWRATLEHALQVRRRHYPNVECFAMSEVWSIYIKFMRKVVMADENLLIKCYLEGLKSRPSLEDMKYENSGDYYGQLKLKCWILDIRNYLVSAAFICRKRLMQQQITVSQNTWGDYLQLVGAFVQQAVIDNEYKYLVSVLCDINCCIEKLTDTQVEALQRVINGLEVVRHTNQARNQQVVLRILEGIINRLFGNSLIMLTRFISKAAFAGGVSLNVLPEHQLTDLKAPLYMCARLIACHPLTNEDKKELRIVMEILVDEGGAHWDAAHRPLTADQSNIADVTRSCTVVQHFNTTAVARYMSLQCLAARVVRRHVTGYQHELHRQLVEFVDLH